jgi:hypothetical protein
MSNSNDLDSPPAVLSAVREQGRLLGIAHARQALAKLKATVRERFGTQFLLPNQATAVANAILADLDDELKRYAALRPGRIGSIQKGS